MVAAMMLSEDNKRCPSRSFLRRTDSLLSADYYWYYYPVREMNRWIRLRNNKGKFMVRIQTSWMMDLPGHVNTDYLFYSTTE